MSGRESTDSFRVIVSKQGLRFGIHLSRANWFFIPFEPVQNGMFVAHSIVV